MGAIAGPILHGRRLEERWLTRKAVDSAGRQLRRLLGPGYLVRKLVVAALIAVTVFLQIVYGGAVVGLRHLEVRMREGSESSEEERQPSLIPDLGKQLKGLFE